MTRRRSGGDGDGERSERWQIERRDGEVKVEVPMTTVEKTSTTIEIGSVEDLEVLPPNRLEDAKTAIPNLEAQETVHRHNEIARKTMSDHHEKARHRR
jgi:hypothetical protein